MMIEGSNYKWAILLSIVLVVLVCLIFGCWYESYEDLLWHFFAGTVSYPPYEIIFTDLYGCFMPLLCKLASAVYPFPIGTVIILTLLLISISVVNHILYLKFKEQNLNRVSALFLLLSLNIIFFSLYVILLNGTRTSIYLAIAGCLPITIFTSQSFQPKYRNYYILFILLLTLSTIVRFYTAWVVTGLFLGLQILFYQKQFLRFFHLKILLVIFLLQTFIVVAFHVYTDKSNHLGKRYEMIYEYAVINREDIVPPVAATVKDRTQLQSALNWFINDTVAIPEAYLSNNINHKGYFSLFTDIPYAIQRFNNVVLMIANLHADYSYSLIPLFLILLHIFITSKRKLKVIALLWTLWVSLTFILLSMIGGIYDRGITPFILVITVGLLMIWWHNTNNVKSKPFYFFYFFVLCFTIILSIRHFNKISSPHRNNFQSHLKLIKLLQAEGEYKPIIMNHLHSVLFSNNALKPIAPKITRYIVALHASYFTFYDFYYKAYLDEHNIKITDGNNITAWLKKHGEGGLVYLANNRGKKIMLDHFRNLYGLNLTLTPLSIDSISYNNDISDDNEILRWFKLEISN